MKDGPLYVDKKVLVDREWYETAISILDGQAGCPFCGSMRDPIVNHTPGFRPRKGCLDCDRWWGPVECEY